MDGEEADEVENAHAEKDRCVAERGDDVAGDQPGKEETADSACESADACDCPNGVLRNGVGNRSEQVRGPALMSGRSEAEEQHRGRDIRGKDSQSGEGHTACAEEHR